MVIATDRTEGDVVVGGVGGDLGESGWWVVRIESSVGVRWSGDRGWCWPGGQQKNRNDYLEDYHFFSTGT